MIALLLLHTTASAAPEPGASDDPHAEVRADLQGTLRSIDAVAASVKGLSEAARLEAAASLRTLSVNDPYTRAAMQLPFALSAVATPLPAEAFEPLARQDWILVQQGLATHVRALQALGVDLPVPRPGDALYGADVPLLDREALLASDDPLAATAALVDGITSVAREIDGVTQARIEAESERVEVVTGLARPCPRGPHALLPGQPWTLGMQLGGWHDALRRAEPFATDPAAEAQVQRMIDALDAFGEASFVSLYGSDRPTEP